MDGKSSVPKELEIEILQRLPVKILFQFKIACKNWYSLIESPTFIIRYSKSLNSRDTNKIICFRKDPITKTHVISLLNHHAAKKVMDLEWPPFLDEGMENKDELCRDINILGPVNGIFCIYHRLIERMVGTLVLWNPATNDYKHILPPIRYPFPFQLLAVQWNTNNYIFNEKLPNGLNVGFGFDNNTNDFKIVVISKWQHFYGPDNDGWHVKVYNLSTDSWRTIYYVTSYSEVVPAPFQGLYPQFPDISSNPEFSYGILNGAFHWSGTWQYTIDGIVAFNMMDDSFKLIKGPSHPLNNYNCRSVWVLEETLATVLCSTDLDGNSLNSIEIWIMKEYNVEDSWTLLHFYRPIDVSMFVGIMLNDQIFCCDGKGQLISYNFESKYLKEYGVYGLCEMLEFGFHVSLRVIKYVETIFPLNTVDYNKVRSVAVNN